MITTPHIQLCPKVRLVKTSWQKRPETGQRLLLAGLTYSHSAGSSTQDSGSHWG